MSSHEVHMAGTDLEGIAARLRAHLEGEQARNSADYYDYRKGIFDGVASCLEAIRSYSQPRNSMDMADGETGARYEAYLNGAIGSLRRVDPETEDPDRFPNVTTAMVEMMGIIEALVSHEFEKVVPNGRDVQA